MTATSKHRPAAGSTAQPRLLAANPILARWLRVRSDGVVEVCAGKVELGQGILTSLAQITADGLRLPLDRVRMVPPTTKDGPDAEVTAGSMSIQDAGPALRIVTSQARQLFAAAAARRLGCEPAEIRVDEGAFRAPEGPSVGYGELANDVDLERPADPAVARDAPGGLVGVSSARLDLPGKVVGQPAYVSDLRLPRQLAGGVLRPPSPSARLTQLDESLLEGLDVQLVRDGSFVGVVGPDEWGVARALQRLAPAATWDERDELPDEDDLPRFLRNGPHEHLELLAEPVDAGVSASRRAHATYSRPFLAHASIAPSGAAACWDADGRVHVWSHTQGIFRLRDSIADALRIDASRVTVEHVHNAGCYGHNGADDAAFDAVLLARAVPGSPVLVRWSRQDELAWSPFGSAMVADVAATMDAEGRVQRWEYDVWSQGHTSRPGYAGVPGLLAASHLERPIEQPAAADPPPTAGAGSLRNAIPLYDVGTRRVTGHRLVETPIRSSALRSLGAFLNVFAIESFMDELAHSVGRDPVEYRRVHLSDERARAVLDRAATAARWGGPMPEGVGRGVGLARYKGTGAYCAVVAEVEAVAEIALRRLVLAVDVGQVVNPDGVRNQIEGGAVQAASWTLKERVRFDRRRITSVDWETYPILRFNEVPPLEVTLIDRPDLPSVGAGECAQGPVAAAIGNAVATAVGVRVRDLPITPEAVVRAIESATE